MKKVDKNDDDISNDHSNDNNITNDNNVVERWLKELSLAEQIGQMSQIDINMLLEDDGNGNKRLNHDSVERYIGEMAIGSVLNTVSSIQWSVRQYREAIILLNQVATKYHRPPIIWGIDSVHGANYIKDAILTPQPINIAATFNSTTSKMCGQLASRDTRAAGMNWLFSPLLGISIESLWSRLYETFGEDPLVVSNMAKAMIIGIQEAPDETSTSIPSRAAACAKHYIGYSMPRTGHDRSPSWIPTRHLYQYFVPPWKYVLTDSTDNDNENNKDHIPKTIMESYTEIDGVPIVANHDLLNYLLRYRLNYTSVVVTDYEEIRNIHNWHHITANDQDAIIYALQQGSVDISMIPFDADGFAKSIIAGIQSNQLSVNRIHQSAKRVLQLKYDLNMFDEIITIVEPNMDLVGTDEELIRPIVEQSIIVVQNNNRILPLNNNQLLKVHVTGPTANSLSMQTGGWTYQWQGSSNEDWFNYGSTIVDTIREIHNWSSTYTCGVDILGMECTDPDETNIDVNIIDQVKHWVGLTPTTSIAEAVQGAKGADVTIVCIGEESYTEKPGDIRSLRLPDGQYDLIHAIKRNTSTKIIVIYFGGRPRLLSNIVDDVDAIILGFLPGPSGGRAIVDIITGVINPSGRLPITYPAADDGGGIPYWHAVTDQCTRGDVGTTLPHYEYVPCIVQWPFGHGLSYTTFKYYDFSAIGGIDDDLHIQLTIQNDGSRIGSDTVMFFTFDESRHTTPEYKRLRAYEKVTLQPNESITIKITVPIDELRFIGPHDDTHYIVDPHMVSYLGAGYDVDCRRRDDDHNPDDNQLCIRLQSQAPNKPYFPACEAACSVWQQSHCSNEMSMTMCMNLCMTVGGEGWGWNYVDCIEGIISDSIQQAVTRDEMSIDCSLLTTKCQDIFNTNTSGLKGANKLPTSSLSNNNTKGNAATYVAFSACVLSFIVILLHLRGSNSSTMIKRRQRHENDDGNFQGIQFSVISR